MKAQQDPLINFGSKGRPNVALERISVSLDEDLIEKFESYLKVNGYKNRSEAIRDLIRDKLESDVVEQDKNGHCVGTLTYVYNHDERELARRLTRVQHHHHDVAISTLHVHLDHDNCMETVVLQGRIAEVQAFANAIISQAGVRHGKLNLVPAEVQGEKHKHGTSEHFHTHTHPKT